VKRKIVVRDEECSGIPSGHGRGRPERMGQVIRKGKESYGMIIQKRKNSRFMRSCSVGHDQGIGRETVLPPLENRIVKARQIFRIFLREDQGIRRIIAGSVIIGGKSENEQDKRNQKQTRISISD
jgi:hypothetical protein